VERAAKHITEWMGFSWDGLLDGRVTDKGFPVFTHGQFGWGFQGHKGDMLDLARAAFPSSPTITSDDIERAARALDPEIWEIGAPVPTRAATEDFHARRSRSIETARTVLTAAFPSAAPAEDAVEQECATEGCDKSAHIHFARDDIGSWYCRGCYLKIQSLAAFPSRGGE
jgi:hypothetical protein